LECAREQLLRIRGSVSVVSAFKVVPEEQALREIQGCRLITADGMNKDWKPPEK
jgi:hypothetical protein